MRKTILFVAALALTFAACNKQAEVQNPQEEAKVRMSFAPAKAPQDADPTLAYFCNHLDVFIIEGTDTIASSKRMLWFWLPVEDITPSPKTVPLA